MQKFGLKKEIIEEIVNIISKYPEVKKAQIYGSRARGDYKYNSDIDIVLFGEKITNSIHTKIYFELEEMYIPYTFDLINFNSLNEEDKLYESILKEGVDIYARES